MNINYFGGVLLITTNTIKIIITTRYTVEYEQLYFTNSD